MEASLGKGKGCVAARAMGRRRWWPLMGPADPPPGTVEQGGGEASPSLPHRWGGRPAPCAHLQVGWYSLSPCDLRERPCYGPDAEGVMAQLRGTGRRSSRQ